LIFVSLLAVLTYATAASAAGCAAYDRIADLLTEARSARGNSKAWRSDGDWKTWESRVRKELEEAGQGKNADTVAKSMRRSLQREQGTAADLQVQKTSGSTSGVSLPLERAAKKNLEVLEKSRPDIYRKFREWEERVAKEGIEKVRKTSSYHDEPLRRSGGRERSIRLNEKYRAIYEVDESGKIRIIDVNGHDYRTK
jgi:proteic killer suppression protein